MIPHGGCVAIAGWRKREKGRKERSPQKFQAAVPSKMQDEDAEVGEKRGRVRHADCISHVIACVFRGRARQSAAPGPRTPGSGFHSAGCRLWRAPSAAGGAGVRAMPRKACKV